MNHLEELTISKFDKDKWVVTTPLDNHILINDKTRELLELLKGSEDKDMALIKFNESFGQNLSGEAFENLITSKLQNLNILANENGSKLKKYSYLKSKITIINKRLSGILAKPFSFLYDPFIFYLTLIGTIIFNLIIGFRHLSFNFSEINPSNIVLYTILLYITMLIHELGHIAACKKFKVGHGEIGFGFYVIFPVLYADVTKIWSLDKQKRIIANLGGIFLEMLYVTILSITYLVTGNFTFLFIAFTIFVKTLTELNPFIRYDGYWILSDLSNTPNLLPRANAAIKVLFNRKKIKSVLFFNEKPRFYALLFYGLVNMAIIIGYILYTVIIYNAEILYFPLSLYEALSDLISGQMQGTLDLLNFHNLMILGLYFLFIRLGIKILIKNSAVAKPDLKRVDR